MSESFREQVERVIQMSRDDGETWDLSVNDQAALKAVLLRMSELDAEVQLLRAEAQSVEAASAAVGKSNPANSDRPSAAGDSPQALREALQSLRNEIVGVMGLASAAIQREIGSTNIRCLERRIDEADRALRSSSAGDEPREEPNGKA